MSTNICLVSMVKAESDQVVIVYCQNQSYAILYFCKEDGFVALKHNRHLASYDCFKFHKFEMKFKQCSLKETMSPSGILNLIYKNEVALAFY